MEAFNKLRSEQYFEFKESIIATPKNIMSTELEVISKIEALQINRVPEEVLAEAQKAAAALQRVIQAKVKKVILNNEQYLEFEDWQILGKFYAVTAKVEWSRPVEFGGAQGFEARAIAISSANGQELSAADSMCLNDENNWRGKPLFMRVCKSPAQCAWLGFSIGWLPAHSCRRDAGGHGTPVQRVAAGGQATRAAGVQRRAGYVGWVQNNPVHEQENWQAIRVLRNDLQRCGRDGIGVRHV